MTDVGAPCGLNVKKVLLAAAQSLVGDIVANVTEGDDVARLLGKLLGSLRIAAREALDLFVDDSSTTTSPTN